jgi:hypothetical protein
MNTEHKSINDIVPHGEFIRGFANQSFLTTTELHRIMKSRGIFFPFHDKDTMVPVLQTLLLSPKEFDEIRECFNAKEDNEKVISRPIIWADNNQPLLQQDILECHLDDFIKKNLPTCKLTKPSRFHSIDNNINHIKADIQLERNDLSKSWYEQKNIFDASVEFIKNPDNKGCVKIIHTAPETKILTEYIAKIKKEEFESKAMITDKNTMKKILFKNFSNEERIVFLFRLSTQLDNNNIFTCLEIGDISLKPENDSNLPEKISWMNQIKKLLMSGQKLNETFFIKEKTYHRHIAIWNIEAKFEYTYNGRIGECLFNFGFPDFGTKQKLDSEFELNLSLPNPKRVRLDAREKKILKNKLLEEMDKQKMIVYNKFIEDKPLKE